MKLSSLLEHRPCKTILLQAQHVLIDNDWDCSDPSVFTWISDLGKIEGLLMLAEKGKVKLDIFVPTDTKQHGPWGTKKFLVFPGLVSSPITRPDNTCEAFSDDIDSLRDFGRILKSYEAVPPTK